MAIALMQGSAGVPFHDPVSLRNAARQRRASNCGKLRSFSWAKSDSFCVTTGGGKASHANPVSRD